MTLYIALDVSLEKTAVCEMDAEGTVIVERVVPSDAARGGDILQPRGQRRGLGLHKDGDRPGHGAARAFLHGRAARPGAVSGRRTFLHPDGPESRPSARTARPIHSSWGEAMSQQIQHIPDPTWAPRHRHGAATARPGAQPWRFDLINGPNMSNLGVGGRDPRTYGLVTSLAALQDSIVAMGQGRGSTCEPSAPIMKVPSSLISTRQRTRWTGS